MNILCLSRVPGAFQTLKEYAINLIMVDSISALMDMLVRIPCSGIILDVKCLMRTNEHHKGLLYEFIDAFPTLRVNSAPDGNSFVPLGDSDAFVTKTCAAFKPRSVRKNRRMHVALPLLLSREQDPEMRNAVKTCSIDLSEKGMFIFSTDEWRIDESAWIQLIDVRDSTPIRARVRWVLPWGTGLRFPGIGIIFDAITPEQHDELCSRFLLRSNDTQRSFISDLSCLDTFLEEEWPELVLVSKENNTSGTIPLQKENGMKSITVKGMHCPKCQSAVTEAMSSLDGIADVDVNLESGLVTFTEEKTVSEEVIKEAIEKIGFDVA